MNDDEFFEYMDAAHAESLHDPEADPDIDYSELALNVHSDLLEAWHAELSTRGNVTDFEIEQLQATKLAIMAYRILQSGRYLETALEVAKCCKVEELSNDQRQRLVNNLTETHKILSVIDEEEPLARHTLEALGLPDNIDDFENFDGNNGRLNISRQAYIDWDRVEEELTAAVQRVSEL